MYSLHTMKFFLHRCDVYQFIRCLVLPVKSTVFSVTFIYTVFSAISLESPAFWLSLPRKVDHRNSLKKTSACMAGIEIDSTSRFASRK